MIERAHAPGRDERKRAGGQQLAVGDQIGTLARSVDLDLGDDRRRPRRPDRRSAARSSHRHQSLRPILARRSPDLGRRDPPPRPRPGRSHRPARAGSWPRCRRPPGPRRPRPGRAPRSGRARRPPSARPRRRRRRWRPPRVDSPDHRCGRRRGRPRGSTRRPRRRRPGPGPRDRRRRRSRARSLPGRAGRSAHRADRWPDTAPSARPGRRRPPIDGSQRAGDGARSAARTKLANSSSPTLPDFSGWNWVAHRRSRSTAAVTGPP